MYLVGTFNRHYSSIGSNDDPLSLVGVVEEISKTNLLNAARDENYQVINLITKEYFDPKQNKWIKIKNF